LKNRRMAQQMNTDATDLPREILQSRNPEISGLFHRVNTD